MPWPGVADSECGHDHKPVNTRCFGGRDDGADSVRDQRRGLADVFDSECADDRVVPSGCCCDDGGVGDVAADDVGARVNGGVGPPNEGGDLVTLVEGLRDEETAGAAGCSKDKKLHKIFAFSRTDETDERA